MPRILETFSRLMPLWVVLAGALGCVEPRALTPFVPYLGWFFAFTMIGVGALLDFTEFLPVLRRPHLVVLGTAAQFGIMPILGYLVASTFPFPPEVALGFVIVGAVPGAMASNVISYLAGADVAYSIALTTTSTFLSPLLTPGATWLLAGQWIDIDFSGMFFAIMQTVVGPLLVGLALRRLLRSRVGPLRAVCPALSTACIALICGAVVADNRNLLVELSVILAIGVVAHNALGLAGGWVVGRLAGFSVRRRRTLAIEVGMQNAGLGAVLATRLFPPGAALPSALFASWCVVTASVLAVWWRSRHGPVPAIAEDEPTSPAPPPPSAGRGS